MRAYRHIVVAGAGVAGLASAGALARMAERVTVVERDRLPRMGVRRGVPQGAHLHNLLGRAQLELERCLPGFLEGLRAGGCGDASVADETHVHELGIEMPERQLGLRLMSASRPLIENVARTRALSHPNVRIIEASVDQVRLDSRSRVCGLVLAAGSGATEIAADLVVDASGPACLTSRVLRAMGRTNPPAEVRETHRWYASSIVVRGAEDVGDPSFWMAFPTGVSTRTGLLSPLDGRRWWCSLSGGADDPPPRTFAEVRGFAETLLDTRIAACLRRARHGSIPQRFRRGVARWRRFDLIDPVGGLLPVGDSFATLDPLAGQGMSVAAWQARRLRDLVERNGSDRDELTAAYLRAGADVCLAAWEVGALVEACASEPGRGSAPSALASAIITDLQLHAAYVRTWHLLEPTAALYTALQSSIAGTALIGVP